MLLIVTHCIIPPDTEKIEQLANLTLKIADQGFIFELVVTHAKKVGAFLPQALHLRVTMGVIFECEEVGHRLIDFVRYLPVGVGS